MPGCDSIAIHEQDAITYFSDDYQQARAKFLEACKGSGAHIKSYKLPIDDQRGKPLYIDVAYIGKREAKNFLVLCSGTHGVEGFAGSAIQTGLLRDGFFSKLKPNMSFVLIHALNPYGFAYLRRFNEDNIDLNRNFIDYTRPLPSNDRYKELADIVFPKNLSSWENMKSRYTLFWYLLKNGRDALRCAISSGQYSLPQGLFYGGQFETWSNKTLRTIVKQYLSNADQVIFFDFHTGLGSFGNAEVIMNSPKSSPEYKRAVKCWGDIVKTTVSDESVSCHIVGSLKLAVPKMLPDAKVTAVSLEFGTYSKMQVLWALRAENWLHNRGREGYPKENTIKNDLLRAFYPDKDDWKIDVWQRGKKVIEQALQCFPPSL